MLSMLNYRTILDFLKYYSTGFITICKEEVKLDAYRVGLKEGELGNI